MNASGPDIPAIQCRTPTGCCGVSPCAISEDQFICQIRTLLPEGDLWNNTLPAAPPEAETSAVGATTVGCATVGCEQLVLGGCCDTGGALPCDIDPTAPQLAVIDAFSAVAHTAVQALCQMLRELDPCTASLTLRRWAARFGLPIDDPCGPQWSDPTLSTLLCEMLKVRLHVINWDYLQALAARFGASLVVRHAGDFSECHPSGWWTMARDRDACAPTVFCPPAEADPAAFPPIRFTPQCDDVPVESLNIILSPSEIMLPENCNDPPVPPVLPHNDELYEAFKWLLPKILPQPVFWCIYERDEANCIV